MNDMLDALASDDHTDAEPETAVAADEVVPYGALNSGHEVQYRVGRSFRSGHRR